MTNHPILLVFPLLSIAGTLALREVFQRPRYLSKNGADFSHVKISIIIPARDEEANIGELLETIQNQSHSAHEVIVVDDSSCDATADIAATHGAKVLSGKSLAEGWKGKPWACQQGAEAATGNHLLFLDADVRLQSSEALAKLAATATDKGAISVNPMHQIKMAYEEASSFFNALMVLGVNAFGRGESNGQQAALFGQCMMLPRSIYHQLGGHSLVKECTLENFHLSQHLRTSGHTCSCFLGGQDITMRMFPNGFIELWNSWKKGFSNGAANTHKRALLLSSLWISGAMFNIVSIAIAPFTENLGFHLITALSYIIYAYQCRRLFSVIGNFSFFNALFFPLALLFYQSLFLVSFIAQKSGKTTVWKGRQVSS